MAHHDKDLFLGLDAGGSKVRAVVATADGTILGRGRSEGANPNSHPPAEAAARLASAAAQALGSVPPDRVAASVLGVAGSGALLRDPHALETAWRALGLTCPARIVGDTDVAFAAGTQAERGAVLIAGTGAIAAWIEPGVDYPPHVDGAGWLLGDEGSGFWFGRQAARAAVAALDGRGAATSLTRAVLDTTANWPSRSAPTSAPSPRDSAGSLPAGGNELVEWLVGQVYKAPPTALARLAPLVSDEARSGDEVAAAIVDQGCELLARTLGTLLERQAPPGWTGAVVLAGSVASTPGPIRDRLTTLVHGRHGIAPSLARDHAGAAAWLACRNLVGARAAPLHRRFTTATL
ncbi:N-acetylglucosamine kinase [Streptomyces sp.]|uniref:N-acetylglucosamine kinase n=1 Tax=Streptomyces sp. TaxID=1931 RepID=UPI002D783D2A|nr:BadF/BadG/BcrA/BcrD ATPase family protein [Streptomyces sp.]HET6354162.1 BadF/BadG/BcrA/BcrD ATPase family protein [Streptomyces sp.]